MPESPERNQSGHEMYANCDPLDTRLLAAYYRGQRWHPLKADVKSSYFVISSDFLSSFSIKLKKLNTDARLP